MKMSNYENKIIYGFSDIKVKKDNVTYDILGAKSVSIDIQIEQVTARNRTQSFVLGQQVTNATGTMTVLSLTAKEEALLFGYKYDESTREIAVGNFTSQEVELSFKQKRADGRNIIYKMFVVFTPSSLDMNTVAGAIEEQNITLNFEIIQKDGVYYRRYEN